MSTVEAVGADNVPGHEMPHTHEFAQDLGQYDHYAHHHPQDNTLITPETAAPSHAIGLKEGHLCSADCPEHREPHENHKSHHLHDHEGVSRPHTIEHKHAEHRCGADCPEHSHENRSTHTSHTAEHHHKHEHTIARKPHACGSDCPEHGSTHAHEAHVHGHAEQHPHAHTVERKLHACGADCPEHGARQADHRPHAHAEPKYEEFVHKNHGHKTNKPEPLANDPAYRAILEVSQRREQTEAIHPHATVDSDSETSPAQTPPVGSTRENIVSAVKTSSPARAGTSLRHQATTEKTKVSAANIVPEPVLHTSEQLGDALQPSKPAGTNSTGAARPEPHTPTVPISYEAASSLESQSLEPTPHTVANEQALAVLPDSEAPLQTPTESLAVSPAAFVEFADTAQPAATVSSEAAGTEPTLAEQPHSLLPFELPAIPPTAQPVAIELARTIETTPPQPAEAAAAQPPERAAAALAQTVAANIAEALETSLQPQVRTTETQAALRASLSRLRVLQRTNGEAQTTMLIRQEMLHILELLGYQNPAQTYGMYLRYYGEQFSAELLQHLLTVISQGRSYEQVDTVGAPPAISPQATTPSIGALILKLYRLSTYLLRPVTVH